MCQSWDFDTGILDQSCTDPCAAFVLRLQATRDAGFVRLANYLDTRGFVADGDSFAIEGRDDNRRATALFTPYRNRITNEFTLLTYAIDATSNVVVVAVSSFENVPKYLIGFNDYGDIEHFPIDFGGSAGVKAMGGPTDPQNPFFVGDVTHNCSNCVDNCETTVKVGIAVAGVMIAIISGGAGVLAAAALKVVAGILAVGAIFGTSGIKRGCKSVCNTMLCSKPHKDCCGGECKNFSKLVPCGETCCDSSQVCCNGKCCSDGQICCNGKCLTPNECQGQKIYCICNNTCYNDATTCLSECKVSLGCFTGICGPAEPGQC